MKLNNIGTHRGNKAVKKHFGGASHMDVEERLKRLQKVSGVLSVNKKKKHKKFPM
jgi:hypothetical protein